MNQTNKNDKSTKQNKTEYSSCLVMWLTNLVEVIWGDINQAASSQCYFTLLNLNNNLFDTRNLNLKCIASPFTEIFP